MSKPASSDLFQTPQVVPIPTKRETAVVEALRQLAGALLPFMGDELRKQSSPIERRLLTVKEAAEYLGRSEQSVRHLVKNGQLHAVRADGRVLLDRRDMDFWIDVNKR